MSNDKHIKGEGSLVPVLELCSSLEWIEVFAPVDFDGVPDSDRQVAAECFIEDVYESLWESGYRVVWAVGQRSTCHGWNGFQGFKQKLRIVGTFDALTETQVDEILGLMNDCEARMRSIWVDTQVSDCDPI